MSAVVFIFILLAISFRVIHKLLDKYVLNTASPYAFSWLTQIVSAVLLLPFAWPYLELPKSGMAWFAIISGILIWTLVSVSTYIAVKKTHVSIKAPLSQSKIIWVFLLGLIIFGETITVQKVVGTVILFIAVSLLLYHPEYKWGRLTDPGVLWVLGNALLASIAAIIDKFALGYFRPELYIFFVYLFPGLILTGFLPKIKKDIKHLWKLHGKITIVTILLSTSAYFFVLKAYSLAEVTLVFPLLQLTTILTVIGGILIMGETEHKWQKIIAAGIAVIGAIVISI
ncbi:DMT family transporter [Candidatus Woesearchaeota archaeon]|nr:DMT family transporter [Candidatus Woesearchaeota archaeon]